jgi:hypothetical protein
MGKNRVSVNHFMGNSKKALISQGLFTATDFVGLLNGAGGRGRTGMPSRALDFELVGATSN